MRLGWKSRSVCAERETEMLKVVIAFFLGVIGLFIGFGVGEGAGLVAGFVTLGVYCFLCQFLPSHTQSPTYAIAGNASATATPPQPLRNSHRPKQARVCEL